MESKAKDFEDEIDDVFNIIRSIRDPEFPNTLEELKVVSRENISIKKLGSLLVIKIIWVPTVPHCSYASHIGLSMRLKLMNDLPNHDRYKIDIIIEDDRHNDKKNLDKQINDKERVYAALENPTISKFLEDLIKSDN